MFWNARPLRKGQRITGKAISRTNQEVARLAGLGVQSPLAIGDGPNGPKVYLAEAIPKLMLVQISDAIPPRDPTTGECSTATGKVYAQSFTGDDKPAVFLDPDAAEIEVVNETEILINKDHKTKDVYVMYDGLRYKILVEIGC